MRLHVLEEYHFAIVLDGLIFDQVKFCVLVLRLSQRSTVTIKDSYLSPEGEPFLHRKYHCPGNELFVLLLISIIGSLLFS